MANLNFPASEIANKNEVQKAAEKRMPKIINNQMPYCTVPVVVGNPGVVEDKDGNLYPSDDSYGFKEIDEGTIPKEGVSEMAKFIPTRDMRGNLWTGTPVDNEDCANKKFVEETINDVVLTPNRVSGTDIISVDENKCLSNVKFKITDSDGTPAGWTYAKLYDKNLAPKDWMSSMTFVDDCAYGNLITGVNLQIYYETESGGFTEHASTPEYRNGWQIHTFVVPEDDGHDPVLEVPVAISWNAPWSAGFTTKESLIPGCTYTLYLRIDTTEVENPSDPEGPPIITYYFGDTYMVKEPGTQLQTDSEGKINTELITKAPIIAMVDKSLFGQGYILDFRYKVTEYVTIDELNQVQKMISNKIPKIPYDFKPYTSVTVLRGGAAVDESDEHYPSDSEYRTMSIDDGWSGKYNTEEMQGAIATRDSIGNLWTGTPIDDQDCVPYSMYKELLERIEALEQKT